jgi:hypothetical protein
MKMFSSYGSEITCVYTMVDIGRWLLDGGYWMVDIGIVGDYRILGSYGDCHYPS